MEKKEYLELLFDVVLFEKGIALSASDIDVDEEIPDVGGDDGYEGI